jgi:hypothetical protein
MLIDFDSRFPNRDIVAHAYKHPSSTGDRTMPKPGLVLGGPVAVARVNQGRWIADCPTAACGGAEFVSLSEQHGFFCCECRNAATDNVCIPVVLPDEKTIGQVAAYLCARPAPATRNWHPDEPVKQLQQENREHGIKLR